MTNAGERRKRAIGPMIGMSMRMSSTTVITTISTRKAMKTFSHPTLPMWAKRVPNLKASPSLPVRASRTDPKVARMLQTMMATTKRTRMARTTTMPNSGPRPGAGPVPGVVVDETGTRYARKETAARRKTGIV